MTTCLKTENLPLLVIGLCPLLLVAASTLNALLMGGLFCAVLLTSSLLLAMIRNLIPHVMRLPMILLLITFVVTLFDLLLSTFYYHWHVTLGIYLPLLAMNCLIIVNAETVVLKNGLKQTFSQSLMLGLCVWGIILLTGCIRDLLSGSLFNESSLILFAMTPGAFLVLGLLMALIQYINLKTAEPRN